jgi:hypothetical protein
MDDAALLTDDEIVALCAVDGRPWPVGLITVGTSAEELGRAGMRGMRSLMVRRLAAVPSDGSGARPHEDIVRDVAGFLDASRRIGAYVAPAQDHSALAGASVTAAQTRDGWLLDTATAAGVHALRHASTDEAAAAITEIAEKARSGELFNRTPDPAAWVCVVRFGSDDAIAVSGSGSDGWDPGRIKDAFGES